MPDLMNWIATVNLDDLIKNEYLIMTFFFIGLLTSIFGKPRWIKYKIITTICLVLALFVIKAFIVNAAVKFNGTSGQALADILNNDLIRFAFNTGLTIHLAYRWVKVVCVLNRKRVKPKSFRTAKEGN